VICRVFDPVSGIDSIPGHNRETAAQDGQATELGQAAALISLQISNKNKNIPGVGL
jgi:hypothetical protein